MKKLDQEIATIKDELILMRKDFHRFPEIGFLRSTEQQRR